MTETKEIALILTGTLPEIAGNFDECKSFYSSELEKYKSVVTSETLPTAKADLTKLRAEVKRLDRIRIDEETRLKAPITAMAAKVKEITGMVSETITQIEKQVKVFEDETRKICKSLMELYLVERYEELNIRIEFRTGDVSPLVGISKMTEKGALKKEARENVEGLAMQARMAQDRVDGRIASIGAQCLAAGLDEALPVEYFEKYLQEPDPVWVSNSARIIKIEVDRKAKEKAEQEARENKKIADALAAQQAEADRQAREKAKAEAKEKADKERKEREEKEDAEKKAEEERKKNEAPKEKPLESPKVEPKTEPAKIAPPVETKTTQATPQAAISEKIPFLVTAIFEIYAKSDADTQRIGKYFEANILKVGIDGLRGITVFPK